MSDTPKTDAVADDSWSGGVALVPYEFAQQQERRITELEKALRNLVDAYYDVDSDDRLPDAIEEANKFL